MSKKHDLNIILKDNGQRIIDDKIDTIDEAIKRLDNMRIKYKGK